MSEIILERKFKVDHERLWNAWTDPKVLKIWWGPKGFTTPVSEIDLRVGGRYLNCMRSPDGKDFWSTGVYKVITPMSKLFLTDSFADKEGNVVPASHYGMPGIWPLEMFVTVEIVEKDGVTEMRLVHTGIPEGMGSEMTKSGWNESFDKLEEYLETGLVSLPKTILIANPGVQEIVVIRTLDAPRAQVFRAYTDPDLITQWWGPAKYKMKIEKFETRRNGVWRFVQSDDDGNEFVCRGVFHEVKPPELIINTFEFEPMVDHVQLQFATFEEKDGKTIFTAKSVYQSVEDRDGELSAEMEAGMNEGFDRLDKLLARMKRQ